MPWDSSDRRSRLPDNWGELKRIVKARAKRTSKLGIEQCEWRLPSRKRCPRLGTDVDHITPGDDHSLTNLRLLCPTHHGKKSSREGLEARNAWKRSKYRPREEHPGTLR
jgi:5-methylcytosine-specific restriction protein A